MSDDKKEIVIVGCGPGAPEYLTLAAGRECMDAEVLLGPQRLLDLFADCQAEKIVMDRPAQETLDLIDRMRGQKRLVVLVSGDPGISSFAVKITERFGRAACRVIPGISSVQVAFARLGMDWADARIISAHGRTPNVSEQELAKFDRIAVLAGSREALEWISSLAAELRNTHEVHLCENLTLVGERVRKVRPAELDGLSAANISSLAIIVLVRKEN